MTELVLYLIRGLPGSGKTTLASKLMGDRLNHLVGPDRGAARFEADQFFYRAGTYQFDGARLGEAHADCQLKTFLAMKAQVGLVIVSNTMSQHWEAQLYLHFAKHFGYTVRVIDLFDGGLTDAELAVRNVHGCPEYRIAAMRERWEK